MQDKTNTNKGKTIIQVKSVEKDFLVGEQKIKVLKGVSLSISEGDFVIIFGPSGCGKSTLLHGVLGLEPPTRGSILYKGKDLYSLGEDERVEYRKDNIGMIYQQSIWIKSLNVERNVSFPLDLYGIDALEVAKKASQVLKIVEMEEWKDHWPTELSSGQQQRVSAARALITDPTLIIADEPTGNLDSASGKELMDFNPDNIIYSLESFNADDNTATIKSTFSAKMILKAEGEVVQKESLLHLNAEQLTSYLSAQPEIKSFSLKFHPGFVKTAPRLVDRIKINLVEDNN